MRALRLNKRLVAELDRQAAAQNTTRDHIIGDLLWSVLLPNEPRKRDDRAFRDAAREAFQQSKREWLEMREQDANISSTRTVETHKSRKKIKEKTQQGQYRCRSCGVIFDQPLKPGRSKKAKQAERRQARRATRWEQKMAEAKAKWHEKFDGDMPSQNIP